MFKIESYLTPYISAYLAKYVKDFSTTQFQVSFWQGGALFQDVNLNLEALENELRLPALTLVSGHIHELRLNVPWTKITSEPIRVYINTFEIVVKLRGQNDCDTSPKSSSDSFTNVFERMKSPPEEEGYMRNLAKKVLQNVEIVFDNVILKYVEDDIVLSLNIRKVVSRCVNNNWEPAFVELSPPTFTLRKLWSCSDLTICLDRANNVGKIENYMDPILYRCSFEVRVLYQYHGLHAQLPYFGRYDVKIDSMNFSAITDQIPILTRLYHLVRLLLYMDSGRKTFSQTVSKTEHDVHEMPGEGGGDASVLSWASWAMSLVPTIPEAIFGPSDESYDTLPECEFSVPIVHYGIYVEKATLELKLVEKGSDRSYYRKPPRLKYTPFMKCEVQGISADLVFRGLESNLKIGVSEVLVNGCGYCPCGVDDFSKSPENDCCQVSTEPYLRVGEASNMFASQSMFNAEYMANVHDDRPPFDYYFKLEGHMDEYTEEHMLQRTPGIALEFMELDPTPLTPIEDDADNYFGVAPTAQTHCSLCRLVTGNTHIKASSSSIHRIKLITYNIKQYDKCIYDFLHDIVFPKTNVFNEVMDTLGGRTLFTFQFSIRAPVIEMIAGDHPDYDNLSHIRAFYRRRRCRDLKPISDDSTKWPKLIMTCDQIDGCYTEPAMKFVRLVECYTGSFVDHPDVVAEYAAKLKISVNRLTVKLNSGTVNAPLIEPCTFRIGHEKHFKPSIQLSTYEHIKMFEISIDSFLLQIAKPNLLVLQVILQSACDENMSLSFLYTTILDDLPLYTGKGDFVLTLFDLRLVYSQTNSITSYRALVRSASATVILPDIIEPIQLLSAPITADHCSKEAARNLVEFFLQYPSTIWTEIESGKPNPESTSLLTTPVCAVYIGACTINLYPRVADWLLYKPGTVINLPKNDVLGTCQRLQPISPLGKTPHEFMPSTSAPDDHDSRSSTSAGSQSLIGIRELYRQPASTHKTEMSSNLSYKSATEAAEEHFYELAADSQQYSWSNEIEGPSQMVTSREYTFEWERWVVAHLALIKRTFLKIEIEANRFSFTGGSAGFLATEPVLNYFVIDTPYILAEPEAPSSASALDKSCFHRKEPIEIKGQALYPLKVVVTDVHGYSTHETAQRMACLPPLSIRLTLTLSDKIAENQYPTVFACIHCDMPPVKLILSTLQVKLLMEFMEISKYALGAVKKASETSFFLVPDPTWENNYKVEATENAPVEVIGRRRIPGSWVKDEGESQSSASVFESVPPSIGTEGSLRKSDKLSTPDIKIDKLKKASLWAQITLSHFQLILRNGETPLELDTSNQLVLEIEDIVSAVDIQPIFMKLTLKVGALSLRCYRRNGDGTWDFGNHNGVIISSGEDITHDIDILGTLATEDDTQEENLPNQPASSAVTQKHGIFNITFTRVLARNYHSKSDVSSPRAKWNAILKKYFKISPKDDEDRRTLDELDIKLKPLDILFCPDAFLPFRAMLHHVLYTRYPKSTDTIDFYSQALSHVNAAPKIPIFNNNTLPLVYLETEMIRIFVQCKNGDIMPAGLHDIALLQIASISLNSQTENPLTRTPVKRELFTLAEKASILNIPGSPVEDRQYQLDFRDVSIVTCKSTDIEKKSRKEFSHRSSVILRAMGENPAFEWNIRQDQTDEIDAVEAHVLLDRIDLFAVFAPPIVYQASRELVFDGILITGQMFEMNIPSTISIGCNTEQLHCLLAIANDLSEFCDTCEEMSNTNHANTNGFASNIDAQSAKIVHTVQSPKTVGSSVTELSGMAPSNKTEYFTSWVSAPSDILITCSCIEVKLYECDLNLEDKKMPRRDQPPQYLINPLICFSLSQPHLISHISTSKQNLEITAYGLFVGCGRNTSRSSDTLTIPLVEEYTLKLFTSIEGRKNPKTEMANPYFTFKLTEFLQSACNASLELFRPIHVFINKELISAAQSMANLIQLFTNASFKNEKGTMLDGDSSQSLGASKHLISGVASVGIVTDQVIFNFTANPAGLPPAELRFAVANMNLTMSSRTKKAFGSFPFSALVEGTLNGTMMSSKLQERTDIIIYPWNIIVESNLQLRCWNFTPKGNILIRADPLKTSLSPQAIIAVLQIYSEYETWFQKQSENNVPRTTKDSDTGLLTQTFYDDLRAGIFRYVFSESSSLPDVYEITFSQSQQTMTWRYPQPRCLSEVNVLPAPIVSASKKTQEYSSIECSLMYWVEAMSQFKEIAVFTLSETAGSKVELPQMEESHDYVSDVWRVALITYHDESDSELTGVRPEILASCLQVNSEYNPKLVHDLNISISVPKASVHLINNLALLEVGLEEKLCRFSLKSLAQQNQEFAKIEFSSTTLSWHQWRNRTKLSVVSYFQCSVVEYSFLTDCVLVDPFHFEFKAGWFGEYLADCVLLAKPIVLKLGSSSLHTLASSFVLWKQLLSAYNGKEVDLLDTTDNARIIPHQTVICNDTASTVDILQDGTDSYVNLLMRQCEGYHWTSPEANPRCRIRLQGESGWSKPFVLSKDGYIVRDAGNNLPVFINASALSASQKMVTMSGGLIIANALDESIDVSIVTKVRDAEDICFSIAGRSHGPSLIINLDEIQHFQFRLTMPHETISQWTTNVKVEDIRNNANRAVAVNLASMEAKSSTICNHNVWCALVEESIDTFSRYLIAICPFFRVKSSLAVPTHTYVSTGKNEVEGSSLLQGKGSELQVDFVGPANTTLHLTFQHDTVPRNSRSRPTIPLNPHGPTMEKGIQPKPIDEILKSLCTQLDETEKAWPFIREEIPSAGWGKLETQPETDVTVEFSPWVPGLPSILIGVKPLALFVNITGTTILFSESTSNEGALNIPSACVFTPSKIKEFFRLGIENEERSYWTPSLEFTEQKSRTDIHYVNLDNRIPIDCFSRLEILGKSETWYITLEARIYKGILVLAMRPTYSIQNRTNAAILVNCLSLPSAIVASENELKLKRNLTKLDAEMTNNSSSEPLVMFHEVSGRPIDDSRIKYLAIGHENSPFWFVQLANFEIIFNNMSGSEVIPGRRIGLAIQTCQPLRTKGTPGKSVRVTQSLILSWVCKYGQVWMSISQDEAPPIVFMNETASHFAVAESNGRSDPYRDNDHFPQYLTLSPFSIGHCSLPSINAKFPVINKSDIEVTILLARHRGSLPGVIQLTSVYYEASQLEWSSEISLNKINGTHSFRIGDYNRAEHFQLQVERLGLSYFVYIRNISTTEISAKEIRGRIAEASSPPMFRNLSTKSNFANTEQQISLPLSSVNPVAESDSTTPVQSTDTRVERNISYRTSRPFPTARIHLPLLRLILTDDCTYFRERREVLGATFQDIWFGITPETDPNPLEILHNKAQENAMINLYLGDFQIDNALYEEKKFDFPVVIKRVHEYEPSQINLVNIEAIDTLFENMSHQKNCLVQFTGLIGLYSPSQRSLQKVWVQVQPIAIYVEDAFYYFLQPNLHGLLNIVYDRLQFLKTKRSRGAISRSSHTSMPSSLPKQTATEATSSSGPYADASDTEKASCIVYQDPTSISNVALASAIFDELNCNFLQNSEPSFQMTWKLQVPPEILSIINEFASPIRMQNLTINPAVAFLTARLSKRLYLAVDHSPLEFSQFDARSILTTNLALGHALSSHYVQGALFGSTNPMKILGSLELIGSPGSMARSFTIGLKDFVVYPVKGLFEGPAGFVTGLTHGCSSLVTNLGSGTLISVRNLAWSVSRNLDRMTLNENEQLQHEEERRVPIDGVSDGIIQGLTGFGIRLLGAIGGLAQHPIESVIDNGASPIRLLAGFGRGLLGVITKPIGGAVELVAMTGQGILAGAGWTPRLKRKHARIHEKISSSSNSTLKYYWMLHRDSPDKDHQILILVDASLCTTAAEPTPISMLLSNEYIYIINPSIGEIENKIKVSSVEVEPSDDSTRLVLKEAPKKNSDMTSLAQERLMDFVKGCAASGASTSETSLHSHEHPSSIPEKTDQAFSLDIYVDPNSKSEFLTVFKQVQAQNSGTIFCLL